MESKSQVLATKLLESVIRKCAGKCYNKKIDGNINSSACEYSMGLVSNLALYKHAGEVAVEEIRKEHLFPHTNEEPTRCTRDVSGPIKARISVGKVPTAAKMTVFPLRPKPRYHSVLKLEKEKTSSTRKNNCSGIHKKHSVVVYNAKPVRIGVPLPVSKREKSPEEKQLDREIDFLRGEYEKKEQLKEKLKIQVETQKKEKGKEKEILCTKLNIHPCALRKAKISYDPYGNAVLVKRDSMENSSVFPSPTAVCKKVVCQGPRKVAALAQNKTAEQMLMEDYRTMKMQSAARGDYKLATCEISPTFGVTFDVGESKTIGPTFAESPKSNHLSMRELYSKKVNKSMVNSDISTQNPSFIGDGSYFPTSSASVTLKRKPSNGYSYTRLLTEDYIMMDSGEMLEPEAMTLLSSVTPQPRNKSVLPERPRYWQKLPPVGLRRWKTRRRSSNDRPLKCKQLPPPPLGLSFGHGIL